MTEEEEETQAESKARADMVEALERFLQLARTGEIDSLILIGLHRNEGMVGMSRLLHTDCQGDAALALTAQIQSISASWMDDLGDELPSPTIGPAEDE